MRLISFLPGLLVVLILFGLYYKSRGILGLKPLTSLLFGSEWKPLKGSFGFFPFILGTFWVTLTAMILAVPVSLLTAIYLSEYAPRSVRGAAKSFVDLLSGIPSVVFGVWGVLMVVPFVAKLAGWLGTYSSGYSVLSGAVVLAIMVFPTIILVCLEVFAAVPRDLRDASLALGATRWETVKHVVLRKGAPGVFAAVVLGFSRAFGETMAVLMVVGNMAQVPKSLFDSAYPLPALIANNYGEMMSVPLYDSALMLAALVLLLVVLVFNLGARITLTRIERRVE
ncbi:MAG: phosphate ABC transporter permease subunit PstC [Candidatus Aminicenantes bacterium]|nr:phosphate ABC transporter permease subunit PstC [Candidatus Aminicenantes bacterium]